MNDSAMLADDDAVANHERILLLHVSGRDHMVASPQLVGVRGHVG
jgi:hypothetical protein